MSSLSNNISNIKYLGATCCIFLFRSENKQLAAFLTVVEVYIFEISLPPQDLINKVFLKRLSLKIAHAASLKEMKFTKSNLILANI